MEQKETKMSPFAKLKRDNMEHLSMIKSLQASIASYKGENTKLRQKIKMLNGLNKECDELNEERIKEIEKRDGIIKKLTEKIDWLVKEKQQSDDNCAYYKRIASLPWYKRIFNRM